MVNQVDVDPEQLEREAAAAVSEAGPMPGSAPIAGAPVAPAPESWGPFIGNLFPMIHWIAIPQWKVEGDARSELVASVGGILDQVFPGGPMNAKWLPYVRLAGAAGMIVAANFDQKTGTLPPLGWKKPKPVEAAKPAAESQPSVN